MKCKPAERRCKACQPQSLSQNEESFELLVNDAKQQKNEQKISLIIVDEESLDDGEVKKTSKLKKCTQVVAKKCKQVVRREKKEKETGEGKLKCPETGKGKSSYCIHKGVIQKEGGSGVVVRGGGGRVVTKYGDYW